MTFGFMVEINEVDNVGVVNGISMSQNVRSVSRRSTFKIIRIG